MSRFLSFILGSALVAAPAMAADSRSEQAAKAESRLAKLTEGRVAGEPVDCVNLRNVRSQTIIPNTAIVYDAGGTIYVNRPRSGAESLDAWDTLVVKPFASRLCSIDTVQLYDTSSRMQTGIVFLGDFIPYKKVKDAAAD